MLSLMDLGGHVENLGEVRVVHAKSKRLPHPNFLELLNFLDSRFQTFEMPPVSLYSLDLEYDSEDALLVSKEYRPRKSTHPFVKHPFALHSIILGIYTIIFFLALTVLFTGPEHGPNLIYSPARSAVSFQRKVFDGALVIENPFTGSPRPELDEAWHRLLQNANIRVSEKTLRKVNGSSIAFADGDGYYAQLSMFHELHCLKRIRHFIHKDYYNPDQSDDARRLDALHTGEFACSISHGVRRIRLTADQITVWRYCGKVSCVAVTFRWSPLFGHQRSASLLLISRNRTNVSISMR